MSGYVFFHFLPLFHENRKKNIRDVLYTFVSGFRQRFLIVLWNTYEKHGILVHLSLKKVKILNKGLKEQKESVY